MKAPFSDESSATAIGGINIENGLDTIHVFGELRLSKDKETLEQVKALEAYFAEVRKTLMAVDNLPEKAAEEVAAVIDTAPNPFQSS